MRFPRGLGLAPIALALAAAAASLFLYSHAPTVHAQCGTASSSPCPTPTPVNAFLSIDPASGDPNTVINVAGGQFLPNEQLSLYWDVTEHVAGSATADANGSFNVRVKPFGSDAPGVHHICASVQPHPCANFSLQAVQPTPSPSPTPSESPSPSATPVGTDGPTAPPSAAPLNGFDVISRPPFVFLPLAGLAAIALAFAFWLANYIRRPRQPATLTSAAVVHRAMRPDYSAGFGAPPAAAPPQSEPSAWDHSLSPPPALPAAPAPRTPPAPQAPEPPSEESEMSNVEWGQPVEWGTGFSDWPDPEPPLVEENPDGPESGG